MLYQWLSLHIAIPTKWCLLSFQTMNVKTGSYFLSYLASVEVILLMNRIHSLKTKNGQMRLKHNVSKFFLLNI